jgi:hypothetical protein
MTFYPHDLQFLLRVYVGKTAIWRSPQSKRPNYIFFLVKVNIYIQRTGLQVCTEIALY